MIIGSALAMIPIYVFYDILLPDYTLGLIGIFHYGLFTISYFLIKLSINYLSKRFEKTRLQKIFMFFALFITFVYIVHTTIASISLYNCVVCSAPWYLEVVINSILYAIPIFITTILYCYYKKATPSEKSKTL